MSKRRKKRSKRRFSPDLSFRPRLDALWADDALSKKSDAAIKDGLDAISSGIKQDVLLRTLLRAYMAAPDASRARLGGLLPDWLRERGHLSALQALAASLSGALRRQALAWMQAAGVDVKESILHSRDLFLSAYHYGDESQAAVAVFWYTHQKKNRAHGMGFLVDYNPPWEGAVKDVVVFPRQNPKRLIDDYLDLWARGGTIMESTGGSEAKTEILTALHCNLDAEISLPRDLLHRRELFARCVLALPDGLHTPSFTLDDFDFLSEHGERPEEIVNFERTVGRRVRMDDGKELLVMGGPDLDDWDDA
jgi:hypothetical protein